MPEYTPDALAQAKIFAKRAEVRDVQDNASLSIAWALIALCERLEDTNGLVSEVTDSNSQSLRVSAWTLPV